MHSPRLRGAFWTSGLRYARAFLATLPQDVQQHARRWGDNKCRRVYRQSALGSDGHQPSVLYRTYATRRKGMRNFPHALNVHRVVARSHLS